MPSLSGKSPPTSNGRHRRKRGRRGQRAREVLGDLYARYAAADGVLPQRWKDLVFAGRVRPTWIEGTDRFWYATRTRLGARFYLVDPEACTRVEAFDHAKVAESLSVALGRPIVGGRLPIDGLEVHE